eukprot:XP_001705433.1 Hypothetical protein GL50803_36562 [Giardia lamblia ATCC 50803]
MGPLLAVLAEEVVEERVVEDALGPHGVCRLDELDDWRGRQEVRGAVDEGLGGVRDDVGLPVEGGQGGEAGNARELKDVDDADGPERREDVDGEADGGDTDCQEQVWRQEQRPGGGKSSGHGEVMEGAPDGHERKEERVERASGPHVQPDLKKLAARKQPARLLATRGRDRGHLDDAHKERPLDPGSLQKRAVVLRKDAHGKDPGSRMKAPEGAADSQRRVLQGAAQKVCGVQTGAR